MPQSGTGSTQPMVIRGSNVRITQLSPSGGVLPGTTYTLTANVTYNISTTSTTGWSIAANSAASKLLKGKPGWKAKYQPRCGECGRFAIPSQKFIGKLECERCRGPVSRWVQ